MGDVVKALWDLVKVILGCMIACVGWLKERDDDGKCKALG